MHVGRSLRAIISTTGGGSWRVPVRPLLQVSSGNVSSHGVLSAVLPAQRGALREACSDAASCTLSQDVLRCGCRQRAGGSKELRHETFRR